MPKVNPKDFLGRKVRKEFDGIFYIGEVVRVKEFTNSFGGYGCYFHIKYEDGDKEDMDFEELTKFMKQYEDRDIKAEPDVSASEPLPDGPSSSSNTSSFVLIHPVISDSSAGVKEDDESLESSSSEPRGSKRSHEDMESIVPDEAPSSGPRIKTEADLHRRQAKDHRHYGNRVLLARQAKNGMMKLGGGNQSMILVPADNKKNENHSRWSAIGNHKAVAYSSVWNPKGPQFAGQPRAAVTSVFWSDEPFSVFMMRALPGKPTLGWEYCGDYKGCLEDDDILGITGSVQNKGEVTKKCLLSDILQSLSGPGGDWHEPIKCWRELILNEIEQEGIEDAKAKSRIEYLRRNLDGQETKSLRKELQKLERILQKKEEILEEWRADRKSGRRPSLAVRSQELGFSHDMPDKDLARLILEFDEFYKEKLIEFVGYNEEIYNYVKDGETTKNAKNKTRESCEPCAKASDWYAIIDQQVEQAGL